MTMSMNSLIEQAARRLEQLRQAGVDIPASSGAESPRSPPQPSQSRHVEIDLERLMRAGFLTPLAPRSLIADQFRVVKRPLIRNAMGRYGADLARAKLIMVTSARAGEGKTFTAINLAMSLATELDTTVLLVDADVTRPAVMDVLGLPRGPGLLDLLRAGSVDLSETLLRTNVDRLSLLPSGTPHERATEMLASDAMERLLQDMASHYADRVIVFDSPPLLLATESQVLASHMGQIVMVVRAEETLQSDVQQALSTIESCPIRLMLLNQARKAATSGYDYAQTES